MKRSKKSMNKVYLVGAGPGGSDLITVRGRDLLSMADVVIYDDLISSTLLRHCPTYAKMIYAGKRGGRSQTAQSKINLTMKKYFDAGKQVIRLKGGDSLFFSRGSVEIAYLKNNSIDYEIIPGVTSAIACAAYAGIPLTDRSLSSSVLFLTGSLASGAKLSRFRWGQYRNAVDTIAIYMGLSQLPRICKELEKANYPGSTPMAVVSWGGRGSQVSCIGTLKSIIKKVRNSNIESPGIIFVGSVVKLKQKMQWYESLPLFGKRVILTRTFKQSDFFSKHLESLGAEVVLCPSIQVKKSNNLSPLVKSLEQLSSFDWILFTSVNAVEIFFEKLLGQRGLDARSLGGVKIAAIGEATNRAIQSYGIKSDVVPKRSNSQGFLESILKADKNIDGKHFLFIRSSIAPKKINRELTLKGARVKQINAYTTKPSNIDIFKKINSLSRNMTNFLLFTSASTVRYFFKRMSKTSLNKNFSAMKIVSMGPQTSEALSNCGIRDYIECDKPTLDGVVKLIGRIK